MNQIIDITGVVLRTDRLVLRPWKESDLQDFHAYARVEGVGQMAGWAPHRSMEESGAILGMFIRGKHTFAVEYCGKVIGSVGIEEYKENVYPEYDALPGREIGYVLSRDYWGQGLMPEAVRAVIHYLFFSVGLDFLIVGHFPRNQQSRRVIEKCGFQYVRTTEFGTSYGIVETSMEYILWNPERRLL